jgi:ABC-type antimicrobial peptide transport system permease subunit
MTRKRIIVYAVLALAIAFLAHQLWYTVLNPLIWNLTYIGTWLARAIHQPDYDSLASERVFDVLAITINALIYFAVLVAGDRSRARLRKRPRASALLAPKN